MKVMGRTHLEVYVCGLVLVRSSCAVSFRFVNESESNLVG